MWVILLTDIRFDRDWKKIEAFIGSKTVIQVITEKVKGGGGRPNYQLKLTAFGFYRTLKND